MSGFGADQGTGATAVLLRADYRRKRARAAFVFIGDGDSAGLHHPAYDFNDEIIPIGASYWVR